MYQITEILLKFLKRIIPIKKITKPQLLYVKDSGKSFTMYL